MRSVAAILFFATCFFVSIKCYSQDPCSARYSSEPNAATLTAAELVHRVLLQTPAAEWNRLDVADVEFVLKCGTQQDAERFFAALRDTSMQIGAATVVEAGPDFVSVAWDDGSHPNLGTFRFQFDQPLIAIPHPGDKVLIRGTYSSYKQEPFCIYMTNASFIHPSKPETSR